MANELDGIDDFFNILHDSSLNFTIIGFTIIIWIKRSVISNDDRVIIGKSPDGSSSGWWLAFNSSNQLRFGTRPGPGVLNSVGTITDTNWHMVAIRRATTLKTIYIDGVQDATTQLHQENNNTTPMTIGQIASVQHLNAIIDEAAVYNTPLTNVKIQQLFGARFKAISDQISPANRVAYYSTDDGTDGESADGDTLKDRSGNENDGTGDNGANNTGLTWRKGQVLSHVTPRAVTYPTAAPAPGAIMNLLQGPNVGAHLQDGRLM